MFVWVLFDLLLSVCCRVHLDLYLLSYSVSVGVFVRVVWVLLVWVLLGAVMWGFF